MGNDIRLRMTARRWNWVCVTFPCWEKGFPPVAFGDSWWYFQPGDGRWEKFKPEISILKVYMWWIYYIFSMKFGFFSSQNQRSTKISWSMCAFFFGARTKNPPTNPPFTFCGVKTPIWKTTSDPPNGFCTSLGFNLRESGSDGGRWEAGNPTLEAFGSTPTVAVATSKFGLKAPKMKQKNRIPSMKSGANLRFSFQENWPSKLGNLW